MDYVALKSLILSIPEAATLFAAGRDADVAALLNAKNQRGPVPIREISAIALESGLYGQCEVQIRKAITTETEAIHRLAFDTLTLLRDDYRLESADVDTTRFQTGLAGYVALEWMTQANADAITALGANRRSKAEKDLGRDVTAIDVETARTTL